MMDRKKDKVLYDGAVCTVTETSNGRVKVDVKVKKQYGYQYNRWSQSMGKVGKTPYGV